MSQFWRNHSPILTYYIVKAVGTDLPNFPYYKQKEKRNWQPLRPVLTWHEAGMGRCK